MALKKLQFVRLRREHEDGTQNPIIQAELASVSALFRRRKSEHDALVAECCVVIIGGFKCVEPCGFAVDDC